MSFTPDTQPFAKSETLMRVPVGLTSPLWGLFAGAAVTGATWWWMTRWMRPQNLEAMFGATSQPAGGVRATTKVEPPTALVAEASIAARSGTVLDPDADLLGQGAEGPTSQAGSETSPNTQSETSPETPNDPQPASPAAASSVEPDRSEPGPFEAPGPALDPPFVVALNTLEAAEPHVGVDAASPTSDVGSEQDVMSRPEHALQSGLSDKPRKKATAPKSDL